MQIHYKRHEFHGEPEERNASLSVFVYDIPYFGACGIFPPLHILNQILKTGGSEGGMSPGATWLPFTLDDRTYQVLVAEVEQLDPGSLGDDARFKFAKFEFDTAFDHVQKWEDWIMDVCDAHREGYHRKLGMD